MYADVFWEGLMVNIEEYVDRTSEMINLPIKPEHRPGVVVNFERIAAIAQLVTEFPLPPEIEAAPVFQP
ncbi:DUF4089 domain-containing protein [Microcoleus sp. A2-D2]|uniref:DUF4089 domain-containing protein n=1 Tax=unclassified Microcoleus TaxID=2642155 RepID=UPI003FA58749